MIAPQTKAPPVAITLSPAEAWARRVQTDVMLSTGPANAREQVSPLNTESRKVLVALAGLLAPGAVVATISGPDLSKKTGLSRRRLIWCLWALRKAGLTGEAEGFVHSGEMMLVVELLIPAQGRESVGRVAS